MIRIGINALYLIPGGVGGTEIYLRSLLQALSDVDAVNQYTVFLNRETDSEIVPAATNFHSFRCGVKASNRAWRIAYEQVWLPAIVSRGKVDVLFNPGFTAPLLNPVPNVTVFHDMQHKRHPEFFRWFDLPFWRMLLFQSAISSTRLIAVSEATRLDLHRYYPLPEGRAVVIPHGVDEQMFQIASQRTPERILLCVSTLHPHKNIERLVRVFAKFSQLNPEYKLVLAGMKGFQAAQIESLVMKFGLSDHVKIPGWITRSALHDLFKRAWAFIYPSTFEGFGMPILEALAAGIPTACSDIDPMRTISGDAALRFDPHSDEEMLAAIRAITSDETMRQRLASSGPERAQLFSWRKCAAATLQVIESTLAQ